MSQPIPDEERTPVVRYTAKELFAKIDKKLDALMDKVDGAASQEEVSDLRERVVVLETTAATRRQVMVTACAVAGTVGGLVGTALALFH